MYSGKVVAKLARLTPLLLTLMLFDVCSVCLFLFYFSGLQLIFFFFKFILLLLLLIVLDSCFVLFVQVFVSAVLFCFGFCLTFCF